MTAASKLAECPAFQKLCGVPCSALIHPWSTHCSLAVLDIFWSSWNGSCKFMLPMFVLQWLLKGRNTDRVHLLHLFWSFLRSSFVGCSMSTGFVTLHCLIRSMLGCYYKHTIAFLPAVLSGLVIFLEQPSRQRLYICSFTCMTMEYMLRQLETAGVLRVGAGLSTGVCMLASAVLMYAARRFDEQAFFWVFSPPPVAKQPPDSNPDPDKRLRVCPHQGSCWTHVLKVTAKYSCVGVVIGLVRTWLPLLGHVFRRPGYVLRRLLPARQRLRLAAFLGGYVCVYSTVVCLLCRLRGYDSALWALPAGLLAGATHVVHPSTEVALTPVASLLELVCRQLAHRELLPHRSLIKGIYFAITAGVLFHARLADPKNCPAFITAMMSTATGKRTEYYLKNITRVRHQFKKASS